MSFNPANLKNYGLFKLLWETPEGSEDGMCHRGLDEVTDEGVSTLVDYAKNHELDGAVSAEGEQVIDEDERALLLHFAEDPFYGDFFEQGTKRAVLDAFGVEVDDSEIAEIGHHPADGGTISITPAVSAYPAGQLARVDITELPGLMQNEYKSRKSEFESSALSESQKGELALGLLKSYTDALWAGGEQPYTEAVGHELLDIFETFGHAARKAAAKDFSGVGFGAAQSLVLGADPNNFGTRFPDAGANASTTYLSMNGAMAAPMAYVDQYREALGLEKGAVEIEKAPPIGYMIGEPSGHNKRGNLSEANAFSTSGLNWGIMIFPGDEQIASLPPKEGFDFAIDCIDALGNAVISRPESGDKIKVVDKDNNPVTVEKVIHNDESGKPASWSATFKNAAGEAIDAADVTGLIVDSSGNVKGDGKTDGSMNMWWWGFCDRNTAQKLYKSKFKIPQLDREVIKIKAGDSTIEVPMAEAQKLIDADIPDLVTNDTFCGFRFNDELQYIRLNGSDELLRGRVEGLTLDPGPGTKRIQGDLIAKTDSPTPMLGNVELETSHGSTRYIDVKDIKEIEKHEDGTVTIKTADDDNFTGTLKSKVPWDNAETIEGKTVLKQTEDFQIRGGFTVKLPGGGTERYEASEVNLIAGETPKDLRISQYMTWVSQNEGMFATDSSEEIVVSNGMRWVNRLDIKESDTDTRPGWAPTGKLTGIEGELERQAGDKILWVRGQYRYGEDSDVNSSAFEGWIQVKNGRILNEGFTKGQPDFGWSAAGPLNWEAKSSFNEFVDPKMRVALFVNGVKDLNDETAARLNLPANWKSYQIPQD